MANASSSTYKRDQVERAIAIASGVHPSEGSAQFASLRVELKRLLERDRKQADEPRGRSAQWAFHGGRAPGRGVDVVYSGYEAFALLIALRLMRGGLTQGRAVTFVRDLRAPLAGFHYEALQVPLDRLRDEVDQDERIRLVRDGVLVQDPERMAYLVALAGERAEAFDLPSPPDRPVSGNICRTVKDLLHRMRGASHERHALVVVELVNAAHHLAYHLDRIEPRSRGRR